VNLGNNLGSRFVPHGNLPNENARYFNRIASWNLCGHVGSSFDLSSIDAMEPVQFEDWVLRRLKDVGHKVSRTPKSHDHGADGIAYHRISGRTYIIQCKHTQRTTSPDQAIGDLLRAQASHMDFVIPALWPSPTPQDLADRRRRRRRVPALD
jgi:Restriction endonuclease